MSIGPAAPLAMTPETFSPSQVRICDSKLLVVEHPVTKSPEVGWVINEVSLWSLHYKGQRSLILCGSSFVRSC